MLGLHCIAYSSTLKMEAADPFETLIYSYGTTWHHIPEDVTVTRAFNLIFTSTSQMWGEVKNSVVG
jgi:hypothetical protein